MTRILVVDDHPIVRAGVIAALSGMDECSVVAEAANGEEALAAIEVTDVDLVLMDLRMPVMGGVAATKRIRAHHPRIVVVILTTYESDGEILTAIEAGASGYLLKSAPREELLAGIRAAAAGQVALAPTVAAALVTAQRQPVKLTDREREVLALIARGRTNRQVAGELFIAETTVKTHLLRAFEKLGVSDRTHAVTRALELGLIESA